MTWETGPLLATTVMLLALTGGSTAIYMSTLAASWPEYVLNVLAGTLLVAFFTEILTSAVADGHPALASTALDTATSPSHLLPAACTVLLSGPCIRAVRHIDTTTP